MTPFRQFQTASLLVASAIALAACSTPSGTSDGMPDQPSNDNLNSNGNLNAQAPAIAVETATTSATVTAIDSTDINAAGTRLQAYDVQFDYALPSTRWGTFSVFAMGTWETQLDVQTTPTAPVTDYLGWASVNNTPLDFKGNLGVEWSRQQWTLGWTTRYFSSYYVADPNSEASAGRFLAQGNGGRVPDQMYHDLSARYQFETSPAGSGGSLSNLLHGLQVRAGVRNVFNKKPPLDLSQYSNYYFSGFGDPRLTTYYLSIRKSFD